ncbi:hypothetical protein QTP88_010651 [Uroleucon formosanum]
MTQWVKFIIEQSTRSELNAASSSISSNMHSISSKAVGFIFNSHLNVSVLFIHVATDRVRPAFCARMFCRDGTSFQASNTAISGNTFKNKDEDLLKFLNLNLGPIIVIFNFEIKMLED